MTSESDILDSLILFADPQTYFWDFIWNLLYLFTEDIFRAFLYGTLGSCVFLLRITNKKMSARTFTIFEIPSDIGRLILGTLAGGVIALFPEVFGMFSSPERGELALSWVFIAFMAGYNVDFMFSVLDRVVDKLKLAKQDNRKEILVNRYKQKLGKAKLDDEKIILKEFIQDMETLV